LNQSILDHDDVVSAYARDWKHYSLAAGYSSMMCDYLNKLLVNGTKDNKIRGMVDKKSVVQGGNYRRQTVQAVSVMIFGISIIYSIFYFYLFYYFYFIIFLLFFHNSWHIIYGRSKLFIQ
jgi:hypothetical protein